MIHGNGLRRLLCCMPIEYDFVRNLRPLCWCLLLTTSVIVATHPACVVCQEVGGTNGGGGNKAIETANRTIVPSDASDIVLNDSIKSIARQVFKKMHDGYSSDEVVLQDELQSRFIRECQKLAADVTALQFNWALLNLRKQGQLKEFETTQRKQVDMESVRFLAEVVARSVQDDSRLSIDRVMCEPTLRKKFNDQAAKIDATTDLYAVRKAAFQLRKTRRLKPELITRIADWGRRVSIFTADELKSDLGQIPVSPGIYIFSDRTGYLYVGESNNLRHRLASHLDDSDGKSLAKYLAENGLENVTVEIHTFEKGSRMDELAVRRAYESELIRSRNPKLNIRP